MDTATRAIFGFTVRQMTRSVRALLFGLLLVLPWGVALLLRLLVAKGVEVPLGGVTLYGLIMVGYVMGFLVPLATLFFGSSLIADEVEGGTLPYLFGRPVPRPRIFLAKYAATSAVLALATGASVLGTYVICLTGDVSGVLGREAGTLFGDLATVTLAVAAYGALFALLGLLMRKPLFWGFLIGFGWENLVAWLPGFLKRFTLLFHLHTLMPHSAGPKGLIENLMAASESRAAALAFLLVYTALFLLLACLAIRRKEASAGESEEA
jgi:ABC-type transport system involved in multi-copper enzyme maturation permease subunit